MTPRIQLPPRHLWITTRGSNNQSGECDSYAKQLEERIARDAAARMAKWIK